MLILGDLIVNVLMLIRFSYSGSTAHVLTLAAKLKLHGIGAVVVMTDCPASMRQIYQQYCRNKVSLITENQEAEITRILRRYRADLLHVHAPALIALGRKLAHTHRLSWGISIHAALLPAQHFILSQSAFIIAGDPFTCRRLADLGYPATFIPEGIDLDEFKPAEKKRFYITFIGESGSFTENSYLAVQKAALLADLPVEIICPERLPSLQGRFHGWLPSSATVLRESQVVLGRRRSLLEGMACGNAAMIVDPNFGGLVESGSLPAAIYSPPLDVDSRKPCYRDIFYTLSHLLKNRTYLADLQQWGRRYIAENHDLDISAELTAKLYREIV